MKLLPLLLTAAEFDGFSRVFGGFLDAGVVLQDVGEVDVRGQVVRIEFEWSFDTTRWPPSRLRMAWVTNSQFQDAPRHDPDGRWEQLFQLVDRLAVVLRAIRTEARFEAELEVIGFELQRLPQGGDRFIRSAKLLEREGIVDEKLRHRHDLDRPGDQFRGRLVLTRLNRDERPGDAGHRVVGAAVEVPSR